MERFDLISWKEIRKWVMGNAVLYGRIYGVMDRWERFDGGTENFAGSCGLVELAKSLSMH